MWPWTGWFHLGPECTSWPSHIDPVDWDLVLMNIKHLHQNFIHPDELSLNGENILKAKATEDNWRDALISFLCSADKISSSPMK